MKKKALIKLTRTNGVVEFINPNDIRSVTVTSSGRVRVNTSHSGNNIVFELSRWAIDNKLKPALNSRYNVIEVESGRSVRKLDRGMDNSVVAVVDRSSGDHTFVFPKGLVRVELNGNKLTVFPTGIDHIEAEILNASDAVRHFDGALVTVS